MSNNEFVEKYKETEIFKENKKYLEDRFRKLKKENNIKNLVLKYNNSLTYNASCRFISRFKKIEISNFLLINENTTIPDIEEILCHEIAHAMSSVYANHDKEWKYNFMKIFPVNYTEIKIYKYIKLPDHLRKYTATCKEGCKYHLELHDYSCCHKHNKFLTYVRNY